ncbi:uncharacterized protein LOC134463311 [Engraulis encrasicolus]|uniref:uncharacterized protein LOC134463311 n=1 Tax=Engraulis encrasicolus TaxID=184585 RepID=UPI002FD23070
MTARRRRLAYLMSVLLTCSTRRSPVTWQHQRCCLWWEKDVPIYTDRQFMTDFRVSKNLFREICVLVEPRMRPDPASRRAAVSLEKRVGIALFKLASCCEYRVVAGKFGVSVTTVHRCVYSFCRVLCSMLHRFIKLPSAEEAQQIAYRNDVRQRIPQVYGAIDGSHIPISAPLEGFRDFVNRKGATSLVLQAVVDDRGLFRNIFAGLPGSTHDSAVLKQSGLFRNEDRHPKGHIVIQATNIPFLLVGDPAYPLLPWLTKAYPGPVLSPSEEAFNKHLNAIRVAVEHSFGRLKARWRVLGRQSDINHLFMPKVISACCVLHNMCEARNQEQIETAPDILPELGNEDEGEDPEDTGREEEENTEAAAIRDALMRHLMSHMNL